MEELGSQLIDLFVMLRYEGPIGFFIALFIVTFTLWLLISRIRGSFRSRPINPGRDLTFLVAGPITAILYAAIKAMDAAQAIFQGGIDADAPLSYGLNGPLALCYLALLGFILGVIAFTLPAKSPAPAP